MTIRAAGVVGIQHIFVGQADTLQVATKSKLITRITKASQFRLINAQDRLPRHQPVGLSSTRRLDSPRHYSDRIVRRALQRVRPS